MRGLACFVGFLLLFPAALGATDPYPSFGKLVDALSQELSWPAAATTQEKILALRAEKVIPPHLTQHHPATPTVVIAFLQGLLQRARAKGDDTRMVMSAMVRAAAASKAPIPTLQPEHIFFPPMSATAPTGPQETEVSPPPSYSPSYPFTAVPSVAVPPKGAKHRMQRKDTRDSRRKEPSREFPRSIFEPGESPADTGAGVFPRR